MSNIISFVAVAAVATALFIYNNHKPKELSLLEANIEALTQLEELDRPEQCLMFVSICNGYGPKLVCRPNGACYYQEHACTPVTGPTYGTCYKIVAP